MVAGRILPNEFVFTGRGGRPISDFSGIKADLDAAIIKTAQKPDPDAEPLRHWRFHDLRRTGSSWIEEEFGREVMHACLGHSLGDRLAETYAPMPGHAPCDKCGAVSHTSLRARASSACYPGYLPHVSQRLSQLP
jgi:hypothetical protein